MKVFKIILRTVVILCIIAVVVFYGGKIVLKALFPIEHIDLIIENAEAQDIDPYLILALIKAESNFVSDAQSHKDAVGLMQLTRPTADWVANKMKYVQYSDDLLIEPWANIRMGTWYLAYLRSLYNGNEKLALCAYNAGLGNVDQWLADATLSKDGKNLDTIPFEETEKYILKIEQFKEIYKKLYPDIKKREHSTIRGGCAVFMG